MCRVLLTVVFSGLPCFFAVISDIVSAFVCFCIPLSSGYFFHIHCISCHMLVIVSMGVSFHNIYSFLLFSFPLHSPSAFHLHSVLVSAHLFLSNQSPLQMINFRCTLQDKGSLASQHSRHVGRHSSLVCMVKELIRDALVDQMLRRLTSLHLIF